MSVRSRTKGRRHGNPPIQRKYRNNPAKAELTMEQIHQFMEDRAENSEYPYQRTWREARRSIEEKMKKKEAPHLQSTITWKRKSYAH